MKIVSKIKKNYPEFVGSLLCLSLGILSGFVSHASDSLWYMNLHKPFFNPPAWIFGPVWTVLYCMMGTAFGILWRERSANKNLISLFLFQLLCNLAWSPIFFYAHRIDLAFLDICILWMSLIFFMIFARKQKLVLILFAPYFVWVTFALLLNFSIWTFNFNDFA